MRAATIFLATIILATSSNTPSDTLDLLWPSPLLKVVDPVAKAANGALRNFILQTARMEPGVQKTNVGGVLSLNIELQHAHLIGISSEFWMFNIHTPQDGNPM